MNSLQRVWRKAASPRHRTAAGAGGLAVALVLGGAVGGTAAYAAPALEGNYEGVSTLLMAGDHEVDWEDVRDFSFQVDHEGYLHGLTGGYFWTCPGGGEPGTTSYFEDSDFPATAVEIDEPFTVEWTSNGGAVDYELVGVISSDGTAEGAVTAEIGFCGATLLAWETSTDAPAPAPDPVDIEPVAPISAWDIARSGITINASGFEQNEEVTVWIAGEHQLVEADSLGELSFNYTRALAAGSYGVEVKTETRSGTVSFEVVADADFFDEPTQTPLLFATPEVWTDAETTNVDVFARYLLADTSIDVVLDGTVIDTIETGDYESVSFTLTEALGIGTHTLELFHPAVSVSTTLEVVSQIDGATAPAGEYFGIATQDVAGTVWTSETNYFPLTFTVDADGRITDFATEYRWVCWLSPDNPTGTIDLDGMPDTRVTSDRAFGIGWEAENLDDIHVYGTVRSDGSASGTIFIDTGSCGLAYLEWNADGEITPTPVVVDAEAPSRDGNTVTIPVVEGVLYVDGDGAELSGVVTLSEGQTLTVAATAEDGFELAEGVVDWVFEYEDDAPAPAPVTIPAVAPTADDLDAAMEGAITAPDEARAGDTITVSIEGASEGAEVGVWLFSSPVYLGAHTVDADGSVTVALPAGTTVGDHRIAAWNGADDALIGWDTIAIVPDDKGEGSGGGNDAGGDADSGDGAVEGSTGSAGGLAATGGAGAGIAGLVALLLIAAGAGVLALRRRVSA